MTAFGRGIWYKLVGGMKLCSGFTTNQKTLLSTHYVSGIMLKVGKQASFSRSSESSDDYGFHIEE